MSKKGARGNPKGEEDQHMKAAEFILREADEAIADPERDEFGDDMKRWLCGAAGGGIGGAMLGGLGIGLAAEAIGIAEMGALAAAGVVGGAVLVPAAVLAGAGYFLADWALSDSPEEKREKREMMIKELFAREVKLRKELEGRVDQMESREKYLELLLAQLQSAYEALRKDDGSSPVAVSA